MTDEQPTVLVVEDERDLADTFGAWLAGDYEVRTAYCGEEALELFDDDVDVVLLDRRMPDLSGDEVLDRIRATDHDTQVAMVTAVEPDFDAFDLGFDDYVVKPAFREELCELVEGLCNRAAYDETVQRHFQLANMLATLEAHKTRTELENSEQYQRARAELAELTDRIEAQRSELTDDDFVALFQTVSSD
jgi:DNA-binding response OmpR family regulator